MGGYYMTPREQDKANRRRQATKRRLEGYDWDFATQQSESPFSSVHWHPCRFPSQVPATVISRLTDKSDLVLDPFVGSATTLVEAQRLGRRSIGIDINPVSALIARSKLISDDTQKVLYYIDRMIDRLSSRWNVLEQADFPESVQHEKWYAASTFAELRRLWSLIALDNSPYADIGRSVFSSVLISVCRETRHWGYICDNSTPKTDRVGDAKAAFIKSLWLYRSAYESKQHWSSTAIPSAEVRLGDAKETLAKIEDDSIDLVVTSPPYFGVADYVKAQRLSMEWFNLDIEPVRKSEIGARSKRHRKTAGPDFLNDLRQVFAECQRVLKNNGYAAVVFGSSPSRQDMLPGFLEDLKRVGFVIEADIPRNISSMRRQFPSLSTERVIILRKEQ
ncbi:MAG: DNA methyltransferase [Sulfitobacter sp.]